MYLLLILFFFFHYSCLVSVVTCSERNSMPNPRLSARSVWSWHASTQKPTITRGDTYALAVSVSSPSHHELPPPPARWLSQATTERRMEDDRRWRRHGGSTHSDTSDTVSEFSDTSESASTVETESGDCDVIFRDMVDRLQF
jgi:hypothetical protein